MGNPPMIYQSVPGPRKLFLEGDSALNPVVLCADGTSISSEHVSRNRTLLSEPLNSSHLSAEVQELFETLRFENEDHKKDADRILKVFETHFIGVTNSTHVTK